MKRIALAVVAALALAFGSGTALAQHMNGGHSGGSFHGGGGSFHGGFHGGSHLGFAIGFPFWGVGFGYPYYGYPYYPYYASYPYNYPYYTGPAYYTDGPAYDQPDSGAYIQRDMNGAPQSSQGAQGGQGQYSYYCPDPAGYFPQVQNCAKGWLKVVPENSPRPPR
jgi:hypothetical protein